MSGNFAIKGGGGRTPNGKCHLKFPFWFFDYLPNLDAMAGKPDLIVPNVDICIKTIVLHRLKIQSCHFIF